MVYIRHYFIGWRYLLRCAANATARHISQLLCCCEKDIYQTSSAKQVRLSVSKTCHFLRIVKLWPIFKDAEVPCHEKLALEALRYQSSSSKAQGGYLGFQVDFAVISPLRFHDTSWLVVTRRITWSLYRSNNCTLVVTPSERLVRHASYTEEKHWNLQAFGR